VEDVQIRDPTDGKSPRWRDKGATLVGGVAAGAYVGGVGVATTAARWGRKPPQDTRLHRKRPRAVATATTATHRRIDAPKTTQ